MTGLAGHYEPKSTKEVLYWPRPDANGDSGEEVWEDEYDGNHNFLGRIQIKDKNGVPVIRYNPPKGFVNRRGFDGTDNYVLVDARGQVKRTPTGDAVNLREGQAVAVSADGSVEYLNDDYARKLFLDAHSKVTVDGSAVTVSESKPVAVAPATVTISAEDAEAFAAFKASQGV